MVQTTEKKFAPGGIAENSAARHNRSHCKGNQMWLPIFYIAKYANIIFIFWYQRRAVFQN
jgi:hypothetical protein